jgi:hypothetical protein
MYGKNRIVLRNNGIVVACGGRSYKPLGRWYQTGLGSYGGFAADLINVDGDCGPTHFTSRSKKQLRDDIIKILKGA